MFLRFGYYVNCSVDAVAELTNSSGPRYSEDQLLNYWLILCKSSYIVPIGRQE